MNHWFWTLMVFLVILWYVVVTFIVSIKGGQDIRTMIKDWENKDS